MGMPCLSVAGVGVKSIASSTVLMLLLFRLMAASAANRLPLIILVFVTVLTYRKRPTAGAPLGFREVEFSRRCVVIVVVVVVTRRLTTWAGEPSQ